MRKLLLTGIILSLLYSCDFDPYFGGYKYNSGTLPASPVNLGAINSEYDDYNMASPTLGTTTPLCFSSSRNSAGNNFDIIYKSLDVIMSKSNGSFQIGESNTSSGYQWIISANSNLTDALNVINTKNDELGPYIIPQGDVSYKKLNGWEFFQKYIFLYASNKAGNFDIYFTHNLTNNTYSEPQNVSFLNSPKDDLYPTISRDSANIYFCSNQEANFDIYKTDADNSESFFASMFNKNQRIITKVTELSSDYDDKCPFIYENIMVFASNRPGGNGGYDLYYSIFQNEQWSTPVNFGPKINTSSDEYRPIIKSTNREFTNELMLFSSNRPGGKGGFDLYYVGIPRNEIVYSY